MTLILYPLSYHYGFLIFISSANVPLKVFGSFLAVYMIMYKSGRYVFYFKILMYFFKGETGDLSEDFVIIN